MAPLYVFAPENGKLTNHKIAVSIGTRKKKRFQRTNYLRCPIFSQTHIEPLENGDLYLYIYMHITNRIWEIDPTNTEMCTSRLETD